MLAAMPTPAISFYLQLVQEARKRIIEGSFFAWKQQMVQKLGQKL